MYPIYTIDKHHLVLYPNYEGKANINAISPRPVHIFKEIDLLGKLGF